MKLKARGLIPTIVYHLLLLLLLLFAGLTYPDPPPEEEGILVNFGTDESGFGTVEPAGDDQQAGDPDLPVETASARQEEEVLPPVDEQTPAVEPEPVRPAPEPVREDLTQDVEETKVIERPQPTPEELERQRQAELERQRQAELERQRQAELERQRQAELERQRQEEQERQRQAELERQRREQAERINNAGQSAFGRQGVGNSEGSEGVTEGSGNQGVTSGTAGANNYGTGGGLGNGISFGLGDRSVGNLPKPNMSGCDVTQKIEVKVDIQVDREGKVVSAVVASATYQDKCIWDMVVDAAKRSTFTSDQNASYRQTGWIKYIISP